MFAQGLVAEVDRLAKQYGFAVNAMSAIGYREFSAYTDLPHLPPHILEAIAEEIKKNTRLYAKRQRTWFRRYPQRYCASDFDETLKTAKAFLNS